MKNLSIVGNYRGSDAEEEYEVERKESVGKAYGCGSNKKIYSMGAEELRGRGRVAEFKKHQHGCLFDTNS
jgi:hypothetical protein